MKQLRAFFPITYHLSPITCSCRGSILLYVVWLVLLLSLFAVGIGSQARFSVDLSERLFAQLRAAYLARGVVQQAALLLASDLTPSSDGVNEPWSNRPDLFDHHPLAGGTVTVTDGQAGGMVRYGLSDEERRVNLNVAPADVLAQLAEGVGQLPEREAAALAAAIEDWRDTDGNERSSGAEDFFYQSLSEAYDCKDGPFENLEELLLVRGMSRAVYQKLEPYLTVYGSGRINLNTASPMVLRALGLSEAGVAGLLTFRAGEDNTADTSDDRQLLTVEGMASELTAYVPAEDLARLAALAKERVLTTRSEAFRISIQAEHGGPSSRVSALCVINRLGTVHLWSER